MTKLDREVVAQQNAQAEASATPVDRHPIAGFVESWYCGVCRNPLQIDPLKPAHEGIVPFSVTATCPTCSVTVDVPYMSTKANVVKRGNSEH